MRCLYGDLTSKVAEYSYYGTDNLHAVVVNSQIYYAHTDVVGNIRGYSRATTRYGTYNYDEFGSLLPGSTPAFASPERPHWKGALLMEPGANLYYMRNRWYEPLTGRFLSEDPIGLAGGLNPYVYASADPIGGFDPLGLAECPPGTRLEGDLKCHEIQTFWPITVIGTPQPRPSPYDVRNGDPCWGNPNYLTCARELGGPMNSPGYDPLPSPYAQVFHDLARYRTGINRATVCFARLQLATVEVGAWFLGLGALALQATTGVVSEAALETINIYLEHATTLSAETIVVGTAGGTFDSFVHRPTKAGEVLLTGTGAMVPMLGATLGTRGACSLHD